ncbi:MAG: hypothetical protein O9293_14135 [Porphyrobacter sp.]|nr:hypothetical protein [Porphyrobacter sp.]
MGRVANRIAGGRFVLDGQEYRVPLNNGPNALHGGPTGFDKAVWEIVEVSEEPLPTVVFAHTSPDGDHDIQQALDGYEGYVGNERPQVIFAEIRDFDLSGLHFGDLPIVIDGNAREGGLRKQTLPSTRMGIVKIGHDCPVTPAASDQVFEIGERGAGHVAPGQLDLAGASAAHNHMWLHQPAAANRDQKAYEDRGARADREKRGGVRQAQQSQDAQNAAEDQEVDGQDIGQVARLGVIPEASEHVPADGRCKGERHNGLVEGSAEGRAPLQLPDQDSWQSAPDERERKFELPQQRCPEFEGRGRVGDVTTLVMRAIVLAGCRRCWLG